MKVLFINACVRGKDLSRSYEIAKEFLRDIKSLNEKIEIEEIDLMKINPPYLTYDNFEELNQLKNNKQLSSPHFDLARQFAEADRVVIAAPYWENSFPAILKAYIENVSVVGITFKYTEHGSEGMCNAKKMIFITTRGGIATGQFSGLEQGGTYLKSLCGLYGIEGFNMVAAEGLDIVGVDVEERLTKAMEIAKSMSKEFIE